MESIAQNLTAVQRRIMDVHNRCPRHKKTARLIAVSKTIDTNRILEAYECGQTDFAENRIQEWLSKKEQLPADCRWHFIGRLQTNKVKYLDKSMTLIHSLDRLSLMEALNKEGEKKHHIWQTLVQVNIAQDGAKTGLSPEDLPRFLDKAQHYPFVALRGLMTIGKFDAPKAETRATFSCLRELRDTMHQHGYIAKDQLTELSMGMSNDFELALEEGATLIRVGTGIFGPRFS